MGRTATLWEIDGRDQPYIATKLSGIHPLIIAMGEVTLMAAGKKTLVGLADAIEWHVREQEYRHGVEKAKGQRTIDEMRQVLADWRRRHPMGKP